MPVVVDSPLVAAMLDPAFYPRRPDSVEQRETHISWVFRAGSLAYKLKKPLVLPFLDYGTAARRAEMCREEVRLNRRLAPRVYRRVVSIVPRGDGYALSSEDDPAAVDHAVEMEAVDEERSLEALSAARVLSASDVEAVARLLADFHASAPVIEGREALRSSLAPITENLTTLRHPARRRPTSTTASSSILACARSMSPATSPSSSWTCSGWATRTALTTSSPPTAGPGAIPATKGCSRSSPPTAPGSAPRWPASGRPSCRMTPWPGVAWGTTRAISSTSGIASPGAPAIRV